MNISLAAIHRRQHVNSALRSLFAYDQCCKTRPFSSTTSRLKQKAKTHYTVLGVHPSTDKDGIRSRWIELSRQYHPDLNTTNDKIYEINLAWEVLGSESERQKYDQELAEAAEERRVEVAQRKAAAEAAKAEAARAEAAKADSLKRRQWDLQDLTNAKRRETTKSTKTPLANYTPPPELSNWRKSETLRPEEPLPSSFVMNQPLSPVEIRRRKHKADLISRSIGGKMFPDGDEPTAGHGVWVEGAKGKVFKIFWDSDPAVVEPLYRRAVKKWNQTRAAYLDNRNISHIIFPDGDDPCKGLGVWIEVKVHGNSEVKFVNYPDIPGDVWQPKYAEADALKARKKLESAYSKVNGLGNVSKFLFPDGDDPCKNYGAWLPSGYIIAPRFEFKPDKHVPYKTWHPAWVLADNMFRQRTAKERKKVLLRIFDEWYFARIERKFKERKLKPWLDIRRGVGWIIAKVASRVMRRWHIFSHNLRNPNELDR